MSIGAGGALPRSCHSPGAEKSADRDLVVMDSPMMHESVFWVAPLGVLAGLLFAGWFFRDMLRQDPGTELMQRIGGHVHQGAMAYLSQQYRVMLLVFAVIALLFAVLAYGFSLQSRWLPFTFLAGIITVQHRSDRIDAQAVDMMFAQPIDRIGDEIVGHFAAAVIV